jgi:Thioredoxin-like
MRTLHLRRAISRLASVAAIAVSINLADGRVLGQGAGPQAGQTLAAKPAWLEGSGNDLRIKLGGAIRDGSGAPASGCTLTVTLETEFARTNLPALIRGNLFQVWVPVGHPHWFNVELAAASADGRRTGRTNLSTFQLREAAIGGLELTVKPPERFLEVTVVDKGGPVRDAFVIADVGGAPFTSKTDEKGVARFPLMKSDKLIRLTAWTNDFRIGGYYFNRKPPRDPSGAKFTIELDKCRPQVVRIIDVAKKAPIPDLDFALTVGTGPPDYQYVGQTPDCEMRTNGKGEAVYRWFPDWKTQGSYVEIRDPHWAKAGDAETVDGVIVFRLKRSRFDARKRVVGRIASTGTNLAGFAVEMWSFQGEEDHNSDVLYAFTDESGAFAADYLPGSTYCINVNDARSVSNIIDLIPYDPVTGKTSPPSLTISDGQPIEVAVTAGPAKAPVAHESVQLETRHEYSWRENGTAHNGRGGRRWWVTTNEQGKARTFAMPGQKINGSIYTPEWRSQVEADVTADGVTRLEFHRPVADARKITGRLLLPREVVAELSGAVVEIGSLDGETEERSSCKTNDKGEFSFESKASRIGIYARTKDRKAAGVARITELDRPLKLTLQPTNELRGQLLGIDDRPLKGRTVHAAVSVGKFEFAKLFPTNFEAAAFDAVTDEQGNYSFSGLPCETPINLGLKSDVPHHDTMLDEIYLLPEETRPRMVSRLGRPTRSVSFAERYEGILRDCRLSNFGAMLILYRPDGGAKQFVTANFMSHDTTKEVYAFMQIDASLGGKSGSAIMTFARSKNWPLPENGKVFALVMDPAGHELGRIEIDLKDPAGPKRVADFIRQHAPAAADAREKWDEAFALARQSGRKVWARISQRYCGPCFRLTRWLDDEKTLLSQDYVFLKIDDVRDLHGVEVAERLTGHEGQGVPFQAIFDSNGKMLITSESPLGNVGHPSGYEGKKHLRKMLTTTRSRLTDQQLDAIVNSLSD